MNIVRKYRHMMRFNFRIYYFMMILTRELFQPQGTLSGCGTT